jgi:hypothetical protein
LGGASLPQSVNEAKFLDVCSKRGKWFRAQKNCFVAARATKHSGQNREYFQCAENAGISDAEKFPHSGPFFGRFSGNQEGLMAGGRKAASCRPESGFQAFSPAGENR